MLNSVAFRVAYLLGVEENVLIRDYKISYDSSNTLKNFDYYTNARLLRSLSRIRQSVLRYTNSYKDHSNVSDASKGFLHKDIEYLKQNNIDVELLFKENTLEDYVNYWTKEINKISLSVLKELELPRSEILNELFYFPSDFTKVTLDKFLADIKSLASPHGIIIYNGSNLKNSLGYTLLADKNVYVSAYGLLNQRYDEGIDFPVTFRFRQDNNQVIYTEKELLDSEIDIPIPFIATSFYKFLKEEKNYDMFVDCDNTDFFKFMGLLEKINDFKGLNKIHLILDYKTSILWHMFEYTSNYKYNIEIVKAERIREHKSVVDVIMSLKISEAIYRDGINRIMLLSSDSDFYGLLTGFNNEAEFCVCYTDSSISDDYLRYIYSNEISNFSLTALETSELLDYHKDECIEYILAQAVSLTPLYKWDNTILTNIVYTNFIKETEVSLEEDYVYSKVLELIKTINISISNDKILLSLGEKIRNLDITKLSIM